MKRIVSVYLPHWPIERRARERIRTRIPGSVDALDAPDQSPFALVEAGPRGVRLTAVNPTARAAGIEAGCALADARAILPTLAVHEARPAADRAELRALALWLGRYGIARNAYGLAVETPSGTRIRQYGLWVDSAGVDHLYGGEAALLADLARRLQGFGITARLGLADTFGAAHALAWHGACQGPRQGMAAPGATLPAIAHLPLSALRLDRARVSLLNRLGFKDIGALAAVPRMALERRFRGREESESVLLRLDQTVGLRDEPRRPLGEPPVFSMRAAFAEPVCSPGHLTHEVQVLGEGLCARLETAGVGLRAARLLLYRSDGTVAEAGCTTSAPTRAPSHLMGLLHDRIDRLDLGFGIDLMVLEAARVEDVRATQDTLAGETRAVSTAKAELIDRLVNRLGRSCVSVIVPHASHWPERSERRHPALTEPPAPIKTLARAPLSSTGLPCSPVSPHRPAVLFAAPEPITVMAGVPQGAPIRFTWRRVIHAITRAAGPERIEPEWWREIGAPIQTRSRDYYALEDEAGGKFWIFRAGRYDTGGETGREDEPPTQWFMHGLFA